MLPACAAAVVVTPAGHAEAPAALVVPALEIEPKKPGAETVQAATDVAPAPLLAAVAVHTPAGHAAQPLALAVPGLATAPYVPGAQTAHATTEVLPACAVQTPGGQLVQLAAPGEGE